MQRSLRIETYRDEATSELDLGALGRLLKRHRRAILIPTVLAFVLVSIFVNVVTPRYTAESQILLENQETFFTRPDRMPSQSEQAALVDPEAVGSQVQLLTSRDLARRAIKDLHLQGNPEFDPAARGIGALTRVLVLLGLARDPTIDPSDVRLVQSFEDKLTVFSPPKTRVITIQFSSKDPDLAARVANELADLYIAEQSSAKRISAKEAADALSGQIADLRVKLAKADEEREHYRAQSGLLSGGNNITVSDQQLSEINSDLSKARSSQADAQAKASLIRELIRSGKTADVPEVVNNDLVRRVSEQRVVAKAQLALESRTLLPGHPRIKELMAQVADLDAALKATARQAATSLENDAKISGQRVANLEAVLAQQKKIATIANGDEVHLRSLDRIAQSYKDQLDSSMTKYQEALARQTSKATPADARIIARAVAPQDPSFPKKLPYIVFGTIATLVFAAGFIIARDLLSTPEPDEAEDVVLAPVAAERETIVGPRHDRVVVAEPPPPARETAPPEPAPPVPAAARPEPPVVEAEKKNPVAAPAVVARPVFERPPAVQPRPGTTPTVTGEALHLAWRGLLDKVKSFGQSAAASREDLGGEGLGASAAPEAGVGWDGGFAMPEPGAHPVAPAAVAAPDRLADDGVPRSAPQHADTSALASRIVDAHVPGRGLHVVGTGVGPGPDATESLLALGRALAERGRAIIVDLNANPKQLARLADPDGTGVQAVTSLPGLSELLAGSASFAEVIHRDKASRLHFIPTGTHEADFRDFDLILDALSETYDFIILLAPDVPHSDIAKVMAPYADFVVLTAAANADATMLGALEADLIRAGARDVIVAGRLGGAANLEPNVA